MTPLGPLGWAAFLAAAGAGATARHLVDGWLRDRTGGGQPWGTLAVNVSGCLLIGVLTGLALHGGVDGTPLTVLGTGALGAYTTFSTLTVETLRLAEDGRVAVAAAHVLASLAAGALAAGLGLTLTRL